MCVGIRIPAATHEDISSLLVSTARKEGCVCPQELAMRISLHCDRNLRRALLMLEASKVCVIWFILVACVAVTIHHYNYQLQDIQCVLMM